MIARILQAFANYALKKNAPGGYAGEDDERWAYTIETDGAPYLTRVLLPRVRIPGLCDFRAVLHHFHRDDGDQPLHSHPWSWGASLVLAGAYVEERLDQVVGHVALTDIRVIRFFNKLTHSDYHRVRALHGDVWTLFIMGPRVQDWGFLVDGEHVPWTTYLGKDN